MLLCRACPDVTTLGARCHARVTDPLRGSSEAGWRAYLDDDGAAVTFCPECAELEFGDGG